jgi:hypothetical protein
MGTVMTLDDIPINTLAIVDRLTRLTGRTHVKVIDAAATVLEKVLLTPMTREERTAYYAGALYFAVGERKTKQPQPKTRAEPAYGTAPEETYQSRDGDNNNPDTWGL